MSRAAEFEALLEPILNSVYGTALHLTRHREEAENVVQEGALRAFRSFHTFQPGTNFKAWFLRIVTNVFWEECRRRKRHPEALAVDESPDLFLFLESMRAPAQGECADPARAFLDRLTQDQISRALQSLPDEFRAVATLYFLQDLSYPEIGEILELPPGTVRSRLHRARKLLQKLLWGLAQEEGLATAAGTSVERARATVPHEERPAPPPATGPP